MSIFGLYFAMLDGGSAHAACSFSFHLLLGMTAWTCRYHDDLEKTCTVLYNEIFFITL